MTQPLNWTVEPLSPEDQKLVDAYKEIGKPLDELPYTREFEDLRKRVGVQDNESSKHSLFKRLITLRKTGRLPRASASGY